MGSDIDFDDSALRRACAFKQAASGQLGVLCAAWSRILPRVYASTRHAFGLIIPPATVCRLYAPRMLACSTMQDGNVYALLLAYNLALYGNTWSAGFAFDDNFAVVRCAVRLSAICRNSPVFTRCTSHVDQQWRCVGKCTIAWIICT